MPQPKWRVGFVLIFVFISLVFAKASDELAVRILGRVRDTSGAAIAGALLSARLSTGAVVANCRADNSGSFFFTVPAGEYLLTVDAPGFAQARLAIASGHRAEAEHRSKPRGLAAIGDGHRRSGRSA